MSCDRYLELLALQLEDSLTEEEARELEEHLSACPGCRAAGAQFTALQGAFNELEDVPAPEGFAQGVMDRIRTEEKPKVIPLFKRPQVRALAGLAACLVLAVGLYGARHSWRKAVEEDMMLRSFSKDVMTEEILGTGETPTSDEDAPLIAAYAAPEPAPYDGVKQIDGFDVEPVEGLPAERLSDSAILVLERIPQGAEELIAPETAVTYSPDTGETGYRWPDVQGEPEVLAQIERLAREQEISAERSSAPAEEAWYHLVILP